MSTHADVVVVGVGGVGSAALWRLAAAGARVVGVDRFTPGHAYGSSHGHTRVYRKAYFEHADYVPLAHHAEALWAELESATGRTLRRRTGVLQLGPADGIVVPGVLSSARRFGLTVEDLDPAEVRARFAGFHASDDLRAVFEPGGGVLYVEECVRAATALACDLGATVLAGRSVTGLTREGPDLVVHTSQEALRCRQVVMTPGAWAPELLADLGLPLRVARKMLLWYGPERPGPSVYDADRGAPAFLYEVPEGIFYGCPAEGEFGVKVAEHSGGAEVSDPLALDRGLHAADERPVRRFIDGYLPGLGRAALLRHEACMYTLTPDAHFALGAHPRRAGVFVACGLSGHGFKFAAAIGDVLAALALGLESPVPIDAFRPDRPLHAA
jgi:sarcosine oxidase